MDEKLDLTAVLDAMYPPGVTWREQRARDKHEGNVPIGGGLDQRVCLHSYYEAAKALFQHAAEGGEWRLRQLARPILYLQGHTVELALKRLIWDFRCIEALDRDIKANRVLEAAKYPSGHDLADLCKWLKEAFEPQGNVLPVPRGLIDIATEFITFEDGDPTRLRYDLGAAPKKADRQNPKTGKDRGLYEKGSFPKVVSAPITRWQRSLDELMTGPLAVRDDFYDDIDRDRWTVTEKLQVLLGIYEQRHQRAGLSTPERLSYEVIALALEGMDDAVAGENDES